MGTKTVSLNDDAYERLKKMKKENESFSDVVRRITGKTYFRDHHGVLSKKSGKEIEETIEKRRKNRFRRYNDQYNSHKFQSKSSPETRTTSIE